METKDTQDKNFDDWTDNVKQLENKALGLGIDKEILRQIERK